jgi:hypothetical protein
VFRAEDCSAIPGLDDPAADVEEGLAAKSGAGLGVCGAEAEYVGFVHLVKAADDVKLYGPAERAREVADGHVGRLVTRVSQTERSAEGDPAGGRRS